MASKPSKDKNQPTIPTEDILFQELKMNEESSSDQGQSNITNLSNGEEVRHF